MKLVCPACGAVASIESWRNNADARQFIGVVSGMPTSVSRSLLGYIALFRPAVPENERGYRGMSWSRALRLAGDVDAMVRETVITWKHKPARPIDTHIWGLAIERVVASPPRDLPLDHHNYLRSVAYGMADDADRRREVDHNRSERNGTLRNEYRGTARRAPTDGMEPVMTPAEMKAIREKNMGRKKC